MHRSLFVPVLLFDTLGTTISLAELPYHSQGSTVVTAFFFVAVLTPFSVNLVKLLMPISSPVMDIKIMNAHQAHPDRVKSVNSVEE